MRKFFPCRKYRELLHLSCVSKITLSGVSLYLCLYVSRSVSFPPSLSFSLSCLSLHLCLFVSPPLCVCLSYSLSLLSVSLLSPRLSVPLCLSPSCLSLCLSFSLPLSHTHTHTHTHTVSWPVQPVRGHHHPPQPKRAHVCGKQRRVFSLKVDACCSGFLFSCQKLQRCEISTTCHSGASGPTRKSLFLQGARAEVTRKVPGTRWVQRALRPYRSECVLWPWL